MKFSSFVAGISVFFLALSVSEAAHACTFSDLQYTTRFASGSGKLADEEQQKIVDWFTRWRDGMGINYVLVFSQSVKDDQEGHALSIQRLHAIRDVLTPLNKDAVDIKYGDARRDDRPNGPRAVVLNEVELSMQPACTKTNTCCPQPIQK